MFCVCQKDKHFDLEMFYVKSCSLFIHIGVLAVFDNMTKYIKLTDDNPDNYLISCTGSIP